MKKFLSILSFCLLTGGLWAQEPLQRSPNVQINSFAGSEIHRTLVFGDKINVRAEPKKDAAVLTQLLAGEPVTILATSEEELEQNSYKTNWVKIGFDKNGKHQEGYAWGGVLALNALQAGDVSFVYGIVKKSAEDEEGFASYEIEIRAVRKNQVVASVKTTERMESGYYSGARLYGDLGLKTCKNVLGFDFNLDACGYSQLEISCLWDGSKLLLLPTLRSVFEGGVFAYSEAYLFPESKDGLAETLLLSEENTEGMVEDGNYQYSLRLVQMKWDGVAWVKPDLEGGN